MAAVYVIEDELNRVFSFYKKENSGQQMYQIKMQNIIEEGSWSKYNHDICKAIFIFFSKRK